MKKSKLYVRANSPLLKRTLELVEKLSPEIIYVEEDEQLRFDTPYLVVDGEVWEGIWQVFTYCEMFINGDDY